MLKKGQSGWINNAHPVDTGPQIDDFEENGWTRYRKSVQGLKRYGIRFNKKKKWRFNWKWTQWYATEAARDEAHRCILKKNDYTSKYYDMEYIER